MKRCSVRKDVAKPYIRRGLSDKWKLILTPDEDKPEDAFISGIFGNFFSLSGNKHRLSGQPLSLD